MHERAHRLDHQPHLLGGSDGDAQAMRQAVAAHGTDDDPARAQEGIGRLGSFRRGEIGQHEITLARPDADTGFFQPARQDGAIDQVVIAPLLHPARLGQRRDRRLLRRDRDIERRAHPVQHVDHRRRRIGPADPHPAQPEHLAEGPRHHGVVAGIDQPRAGVVIGPRDVFRIGRVQHQQHVGGQPRAQPRDLLVGQHRAGGIVRIGQEHNARGSGHACQQRIDIRRQVPLRRLGDLAARVGRGDVVDGKPVRRHHNIASLAAIGKAELVDDIVRSRAADDARRIKPPARADRPAQRVRPAIGIAVQFVGHAREGRLRAGRHAERPLVRRELHRAVHAGDGRFAADIGGDAQDFRAGLRRGHDFGASIGMA